MIYGRKQPDKSPLWNKVVKIKRLAVIGKSQGMSIHASWLRSLKWDRSTILKMTLNLDDESITVRKVGEIQDEE